MIAVLAPAIFAALGQHFVDVIQHPQLDVDGAIAGRIGGIPVPIGIARKKRGGLVQVIST